MELVIKIPEGLKNDFESEQWTALSCMEMKNALEKATPLPKGHGRLIDASEKVTMQVFDDEYEEILEKTMTIEDFLTLYADDGYTIIIEADEESEEA